MEAITPDVERALARIWNSAGAVVGAGFLVGDAELITCAHVVALAAGVAADSVEPPQGPVRVDFPLRAAGELQQATVATWQPRDGAGRGDIASLRLDGPAPDGTAPARLAATDTWGHEFGVFGFPARFAGGTFVTGKMRRPDVYGRVQLDGDPASGFDIEAGFSGAPVWDQQVGAVVGMAVTAARDPRARAAWMIPTVALGEQCAAARAARVGHCPYRGLRPFTEDDRDDFLGRDGDSDRLAGALSRSALVAVVGPSGSGKSSLVFAGAVPRLRAEGWQVVTMQPGHPPSSPFPALARALAPDPTHQVDALAQRLEESEGVLLEEVRNRLAGEPDRRLLLVVDQAEELFAHDPQVQRRFAAALVHAAAAQRTSAGPELVVALTLRSDFLEQLLQLPGLASLAQLVALGPMTRQQLQSAVAGPPATAVRFESGLVDRILDDVGDAEPGVLPLLEFALTKLWEAAGDAAAISHGAYARIGGVSQALAAHAEDAYLALAPEQQRLARRLLTQLVTAVDEVRLVRRPLYREQLPDALWQVAQILSGHRLVVVTAADAPPVPEVPAVSDARAAPGAPAVSDGPAASDRQAVSDEPAASDGLFQVQLAHEALIRGWSRLRGWVAEDRPFRVWLDRMRDAATTWESAGDDGSLLRGKQLAEARRRLADRGDEIGGRERDYIAASLAGRQRRRLAAAVAVAAVLALLGVLIPQLYRTSQERDEVRRVSASQQLAREADERANGDPDLSLLLTVAALDTADTPEANRSLILQAMRRNNVRRIVTDLDGPATTVAASPDGRTVAVGGLGDAVADGGISSAVAVYRPAAAPGGVTRLAELSETGSVHSVAVSPDGSRVAVATESAASVWEFPARGPAVRIARAATDAESTVIFGRTAGTVFIADKTAVSRLDVAGQTTRPALPGRRPSDVKALALGPQEQIITADSGGATLWQADGRPQRQFAFEYPNRRRVALAVSHDGSRLAATGDSGTRLWDLRTGATLAKTSTGARALTFSVDDRTLFAAAGKTIKVFDVDAMIAEHAAGGTSPVALPLTAHAAPVAGIAAGPDANTLMSADEHGRLIVWDVNPANVLRGTGDSINSLRLHPSRPVLAMGSDPKRSADRKTVSPSGVSFFDLTTMTPQSTVPNMEEVAFAPDGTTAIAGLRRVEVRPERGAAVSLPFPPPTKTGNFVLSGRLTFSPDGKLLVGTGSTLRREGGTILGETTLVIWSVPDRRLLAVEAGSGLGDPGLTVPPQDASFSPRGDLLAFIRDPGDLGGGDQVVVLWDTRQHREVGTLPAIDGQGIEFHPKDQLLAVGRVDRVTVWNTDSRTTVRELLTPTVPNLYSGEPQAIEADRLAYNDDGSLLAIRDSSGLALLNTAGDSATDTYLSMAGGLFGTLLALSPGGYKSGYLATESSSNRVIVLRLDRQALRARICGMLDRGFEPGERELYHPRSDRPCNAS